MTERPPDPGTSNGRESFDLALRSDAACIPAEVSEETEQRIRAALARERPLDGPPARRESFLRPWLAGSLAGLGVAATVVLLIGRIGEEAPVPVPRPDVSVADVARGDASSEFLQSFREQVPLNAETAELTAPLERELEHLKSDLEKARENVERDLALTF